MSEIIIEPKYPKNSPIWETKYQDFWEHSVMARYGENGDRKLTTTLELLDRESRRTGTVLQKARAKLGEAKAKEAKEAKEAKKATTEPIHVEVWYALCDLVHTQPDDPVVQAVRELNPSSFTWPPGTGSTVGIENDGHDWTMEQIWTFKLLYLLLFCLGYELEPRLPLPQAISANPA